MCQKHLYFAEGTDLTFLCIHCPQSQLYLGFVAADSFSDMGRHLKKIKKSKCACHSFSR